MRTRNRGWPHARGQRARTTSLALASDITRHERENEDDREADRKQTVQQREAGAVGSESGAAFQIWRIAAQNSLSIDYDRHRPSPIVYRPLMRMAAQARLPAPPLQRTKPA